MRGRDGMRALVVRSIVSETPSIVSMRMEDPEGAPLPAWEPGAHIDLQLVTRHERQYSLCGDPSDRHGYRIAVRREAYSRGASHYIHSFLREGSRVFVGPPRNLFALAPAESYLLLAAGIGITPVLSMARRLAAEGASWRMVYLVRDPDDVAFRTELAELGDRVQVHISLRDGRLDLADVLSRQPARTDVYACGPQGFGDALDQARGALVDGRVHMERFEPVRREHLPNRRFEVVCSVSGVTARVPEDTTMIAALARAGVDVPASCLRGVCGSCAVPLLQGLAEHRDSLGTDEASGVVYPCVSRAISPTLVIGA